MNLASRRSFLKALGLASAGLVLLPDDLPRRIWALGAPLRLWGDGVHDDAPALQALLDGRWKEVWGAERFAHDDSRVLALKAGRFRVDATLTLPSNREFRGTMEVPQIIVTHPDAVFTAPIENRNMTVRDLWFESTHNVLFEGWK